MRLAIPLCAVLVVAALAAPAAASVLTAITNVGTYDNNGYFDGSAGYEFTPAVNMSVVSLGYFDKALWESTGQMSAQHAVAIFDESTQALIASATVSPTDALDSSGYRFTSITPVALEGGHAYILTAFFGTNGDPYFMYQNSGLVTASDVTVTQWSGRYNPTSGGSALYPTVTSSENGYFMGNFQYEIPEPCTLAVLVLGAAALLRRRKTA